MAALSFLLLYAAYKSTLVYYAIAVSILKNETIIIYFFFASENASPNSNVPSA